MIQDISRGYRFTWTAGVCVEILQESEEGVGGNPVYGYYSAPGFCILAAKHSCHDITASNKDGSVCRQDAP